MKELLGSVMAGPKTFGAYASPLAAAVGEPPAISTAQGERSCEALYLAKGLLSYREWRRSFAANPSGFSAARRLIWSFGGHSAMLVGDGLYGLQDQRLAEPNAETEVALWHPLTASREESLAWRRRLQALDIAQPFKQAHRKVFMLDDADRRTRIYSARFAANIIHQQRFHGLCRERGWSYELQGLRDSFNVPSRALDAWQLVAEFWVEPTDGEGRPARDGFPHLITDQVCFRDRDGRRLSLEDVPPMVFSEILRDVDIFVAEANVGNGQV